MVFGIVIVTYNRLNKLQKCLDAYASQSYPPKLILVVNNASTDSTAQFLDIWERQNSQKSICKKVIHCKHNTGGAGGFAKGIKYMSAQNVDWIWVADDDAYPNKDCLQKLTNYYCSLSDEEKGRIAALCGKVMNANGTSVFHRRLLSKKLLQIKEIPIPEQDYQKDSIDIDLFSFVGTAIKKSVIRQIGLPRKDYFICFDDTEYSLRVRREGSIRCVPSAVIFHDSMEDKIDKYSWKNYYRFRNKLYTYKKYFPQRYYWVEQLKTGYQVFRYHNNRLSWKQLFQAQYACRKEKLGLVKK